MRDGGGVASQPVQGAQHAQPRLHNPSALALLHGGQLAAVQVDTVISAAQRDAVVGGAKLHLHRFAPGVLAVPHLGELVVPALRVAQLAGEIVDRQSAGSGAHGDKGVVLVDVAAPRRHLLW